MKKGLESSNEKILKGYNGKIIKGYSLEKSTVMKSSSNLMKKQID